MQKNITSFFQSPQKRARPEDEKPAAASPAKEASTEEKKVDDPESASKKPKVASGEDAGTREQGKLGFSAPVQLPLSNSDKV